MDKLKEAQGQILKGTEAFNSVNGYPVEFQMCLSASLDRVLKIWFRPYLDHILTPNWGSVGYSLLAVQATSFLPLIAAKRITTPMLPARRPTAS